jgi:hypothetical protein
LLAAVGVVDYCLVQRWCSPPSIPLLLALVALAGVEIAPVHQTQRKEAIHRFLPLLPLVAGEAVLATPWVYSKTVALAALVVVATVATRTWLVPVVLEPRVRETMAVTVAREITTLAAVAVVLVLLVHTALLLEETAEMVCQAA